MGPNGWAAVHSLCPWQRSLDDVGALFALCVCHAEAGGYGRATLAKSPSGAVGPVALEPVPCHAYGAHTVADSHFHHTNTMLRASACA